MDITSTYLGYSTSNYDSTINRNNSVKNSNSSAKVEEYYTNLCKKFPDIAFNTTGSLVAGSSNKVVVNISSACIEKMANDPEFAKEVEWNLSGEVSANSLIYSWAKRDGVEVVGRQITYDANGNRQSSCGGMRTATSTGYNTTNATNIGKENHKKKEDNLKRLHEKRKEQKEYLEKLHEKSKERKEYIKEIQENVSPRNKAYAQTEDADLYSIIDKKI